jgi:predicted nucleic acid-binding protein
MILVDTSVWIDYFRERDTPPVLRLDRLIADGGDLCVCGVILTEVLQGFRNEQEYRRARDHFAALNYLEVNRAAHLRGAEIYRSLRARGITVRGVIDCLIASCCIEHGTSLLHNDRDFDAITKHIPIELA